LKRDVYHIFNAQTKRTAQKRYGEVMAQRERYVQETPAAAAIFDCKCSGGYLGNTCFNLFFATNS